MRSRSSGPGRGAAPSSVSIRIATRRGFRLRPVVRAHGWVRLAPLRETPRGFATAALLEDLPAGLDVAQERAGAPLSVRLAARSPLQPSHREAARRVVARMVHLDRDLSALHGLVRREPGLAWIARGGWGHLLAAPTFFEDAAKMILTTNCTWKQTEAFCHRLVSRWGEPVFGDEARDSAALGGARSGPRRVEASAASAAPTAPQALPLRTFPRPERLARIAQASLRRAVGCGYRAPYLVALARRAAAGEFDGIGGTARDEAEALVSSILGCGPYATRHLLHLLGHDERVPWDSWLCRKAREIHFGGRKPSQAALDRLYERFGPHQGAVAWFDLNREHFRDGAGLW